MFGERLRIVLNERDITQLQLSQELGLTQQAINRWCQNITQPDNENIVKIAKFLKVTTDFLLGNDEDLSEETEELKEKEVLKKFLINIGYIKNGDDLTKEELKKLVEFVKTNKKYIKDIK